MRCRDGWTPVSDELALIRDVVLGVPSTWSFHQGELVTLDRALRRTGSV